MNIAIKGELTTYKDANDAYLAGVDLKEYIRQSAPSGGKELIGISDLTTQILDRFVNYEKIKGVKSRNFPWFNKTIKGFR